MRQKKLENRVKELFKRQNFHLEKDGNSFKASKNSESLVLKIFSSEKYSLNDLKNSVSPEDKVFVDEQLKSVKKELENDVSVIKDEDETEKIETPSYEIIGTIAIINRLSDIDRDDAVEGIRHHNPNVETVLLKKTGLKGEYRVGEYEILYGNTTETVHTEFGCRYRVDPTKVYFSERFSTERKRVIDQIEKDEKVLVMFSGVGPFSIMAVRLAEPEKVVSVEKNPEAVKFQEENVKLNKVEKMVDIFEGDVNHILPELNSFDRLIMPLPEASNLFLETAFEHTEPDGIIHYYRFLEDKNWRSIEKEIEAVSKKTGREYEILNRTICGERAAYIDRVCLDLKLK